MPSSLRQSALFITGSVLGGLLAAVLLLQLLPGLARPETSSPAAAGTAQAATAPRSAGNAAPALASRAPRARELPPDVGWADRFATPTTSFAPAVRRSAPAVVSIYARRSARPAAGSEQPLGAPVQPRYRDGLGSGVIVDADGHIVTNQHVILNAAQIRVQLADGREAAAQLVGRDPDTDLAVLKIDLPDPPVMQLGRSGSVAVGDVVLAIGNPLGLSQTVTAGIVSATGRADLGVATFEDFIQTDAAINEGNSGGALVNTRGELIGINTAVLGRNLDAEGIGMAIPVDMVRGVMREILDNGRVVRGWVGIVLEDVPEEYARYEGLAHGGVVVSDFYRGSTALRAGLARGDVLESLDGTPLRSARDALARIAGRRPGSTIRLSGLRGAERLNIDVPVIDTPQR